MEDLWAFNEEVVARAIAASPIPVVSAVGHETDVTIADLVADLRAPTPSAAAESVVPDGEQLRRELRQHAERMDAALRYRLDDARFRARDALDSLDRCAERMLAARRDALRAAARHLSALSPLAALARGYAVPVSPDGRVMRRREEFRGGEPFTLRLIDGAVSCRVEDAREDLPNDERE
jgi:exodeoxyribonuclease VII large subunit